MSVSELPRVMCPFGITVINFIFFLLRYTSIIYGTLELCLLSFSFFFLSSIFRSSALVASHRRNHKKFNHHHQNNSLSFLHKKNRIMAKKHSAFPILNCKTNSGKHRRRKGQERILVILAAQLGPNGRLSCLHSFKIF